MVAKWKQLSSEEIHQLYNESSTQKEFFMKMGYKESKDYSSTMKKLKEVYPDITFSHSKYKAGQVIGDITLLKECGRTEGSKLVIWECQCNKCGKIFQQTAKYWKTSCSDCNRLAYMNSVMDDIKGKTFNFLIPIEPVIETTGAIRWICTCTLCGKKTQPILASNIKSGHVKSCGCLKSSGEQKTKNALEVLGVPYVQEYSFPDLYGDKKQLRFDFALLNDNRPYAVIECNGEQHYTAIDRFGGEDAFEKLQEYDKRKRNYCAEHSIKLIVIDYKDYNKIDADYIKKLME